MYLIMLWLLYSKIFSIHFLLIRFFSNHFSLRSLNICAQHFLLISYGYRVLKDTLFHKLDDLCLPGKRVSIIKRYKPIYSAACLCSLATVQSAKIISRTCVLVLVFQSECAINMLYMPRHIFPASHRPDQNNSHFSRSSILNDML